MEGFNGRSSRRVKVCLQLSVQTQQICIILPKIKSVMMVNNYLKRFIRLYGIGYPVTGMIDVNLRLRGSCSHEKF